MNTSSSTSPSSSPSTPSCCGGPFNQRCRKQLEEMEQCVRKEPVKSVVIAAAAGYVMNHVPVLPLLRSGLRLAVNLLPSALVVVGAVKLFDALTRPTPPPPEPEEPRTYSGF